jgi:Ion channel
VQNDKEWWKWFRSGSEEFVELDDPSATSDTDSGLIVPLLGRVFWILRRMSPVEHLKHFVPALHPSRGTPPWFTDLWILLSWGLFLILAMAGFRCGVLLSIFYVFLAAQVVQTSVYHNIWRTALKLSPGMTGVYSHVRNLSISVLNVIAVWWLFGLAYWSLGANHFSQDFAGSWQAIYFSVIVGSTLGFDMIHPSGRVTSLLIVVEIVLSLISIAIVVGHGISAVGHLRERRESARKDRV